MATGSCGRSDRTARRRRASAKSTPTKRKSSARIFTDFAGGKSPRAIAKDLNDRGVAGPRGVPWGASTIYGNWRRGTGILNNELYVGRLVWNRQRFVKDPEMNRRQARPNPKGNGSSRRCRTCGSSATNCGRA